MLIEDSSLDDIVAYFERSGITLRVHNERPPHSLADDPRLQVRWWVDLIGSDGRTVWPHFGSGQGQESAMRSAAARWRIEQVGQDNQRRPGDPLP